MVTAMHPCSECGAAVWPKSTICRSCSERRRWENPNDPRRLKLVERNRAANPHRLYEDREWLRSRYEDERLTLREISEEAGCGLRTIARWMAIHGIATRSTSEALKLSGRVSRRIGPANPAWRGGRVCPDCGGQRSYSATRCQLCAARERTVIGDVGPLVRMWCFDHWRPSVFARDSFACQDCGDARGGNLNAHHIVHLSKLVRRYLSEWAADVSTADARHAFVRRLVTETEVGDIANGVTLCDDCHWARHEAEGWPYHRPRKRAA